MNRVLLYVVVKMHLLAAVFLFLAFFFGSVGVFNEEASAAVVHGRGRGLQSFSVLPSGGEQTFTKFRVLKGVSSSSRVAPVEAGSVVVTLDDNGRLTAFDNDSGKILWYVALAGGQRSLYSASLLYSQGTVLCAIDNFLYGLDPSTGKIKWKSTLRSFLSGELVLVNEGDSVAALTIDSYLYVFDVETGGLLWHHEEPGVEVRVSGALSVAYLSRNGQDAVFVLFPDGKAKRLDSRSGDVLWESAVGEYNQGSVGDVRIAPVVVGDFVFAADGEGSLVCLSANTGEFIWSQGIGVRGISKVDEKTVFVITADSQLVALDAESRVQLWSLTLQEIGKKRWSWNAPVMANGKLWVLGSNGDLLGVSALSGAVEEMYKLEAGHFYKPPVLIGGSLYATAGRDGLVVVS
ncbi:PQQ-binding-like beta-propeller repeat protein [Anaplasma platys]|nr:PQQ-binding-like beta-propeller repeat protein [Anaplasma platys]